MPALLAGLALLGCASARPALPTDAERVVLLHGLGRSERSMAPLARYLEEHGFRTRSVGYASTELPVRELTETLHEELRACCLEDARPLHFVTHSLGGILARAYIRLYPPPDLGRVVMLSPPNKGSELADAVQETWLSEINPVPAVSDLGTGPDSVPNLLGPATFDLGVITGDRSWHPIGALLIDGENDGVVSVESARLEGMNAFLVVPANHTFIVRDPEVARQVVHFLRTGAFLPPEEAE